MRVAISVKRSDIERGIASDCSRCMLARAIRRKVKGRISVFPSLYTKGDVFIGQMHRRLTFRANRAAYRFDHDGRTSLKPFTFHLNIPRELVRGQS